MSESTLTKEREPIRTQHTIDNITYTIISSANENAAQTLQAKLESMIGREIAKIAANP